MKGGLLATLQERYILISKIHDFTAITGNCKYTWGRVSHNSESFHKGSGRPRNTRKWKTSLTDLLNTSVNTFDKSTQPKNFGSLHPTKAA